MNCRIRTASFLSIASLIVSTFCVPATAASSPFSALRAALSPDSKSQEQVGPGVTHLSETRSSGPLNFNVLKVDLTNPHIFFEIEQGKDRMNTGGRVADVSKRESWSAHSVVGGVNGDFWVNTPGMYTPVGMMVADNTIWTMPSPSRSAVCFLDNNDVIIKALSMDLTAESMGQKVQIEKLNNIKSTGSVTLFTLPFSRPVPMREGYTNIVMRLKSPSFLPNQPATATVTEVPAEHAVNLTTSTLVLSIPASQKKIIHLFRKGAEVNLLAKVPEVNGIIRECVGGGPRILRDGKVSVEQEKEHVGQKFSTDRHPRTALGLSADRKTLFLVTVDGRQPLISIGESLYELADYLRSLGCADAINLDGGGSTTMVVRGSVVNKPSDLQGPRSVANSVLVMSNAAPGPLSQIQVEPTGNPLLLPQGSPVEFSAHGFDANFNPVPVPDPSWTASSGEIQPDVQGAQFKSTQPGDAEIRINSGKVNATASIRIEPVKTIETDPDVLVLSSGETSALKINARGDSGNLKLQPQMVKLSTDTDAVSASLSEVSGMHMGSGKISIGIGTAKASIPYFVDKYDGLIVEDFDTVPANAKLSGMQFDENKSTVTLHWQKKKQGKGSLEFHYAMTRGGTSKIGLPLNATVEREPAKFGIWIYGDGKEAWVRADVEDSDGHHFLLDFTDGSKGVYWKNKWQHIFVPARKLTPRPQNPGAVPSYPLKIDEIYVAQDQEVLKRTGTLLLDQLEAVYPPGTRN